MTNNTSAGTNIQPAPSAARADDTTARGFRSATISVMARATTMATVRAYRLIEPILPVGDSKGGAISRRRSDAAFALNRLSEFRQEAATATPSARPSTRADDALRRGHQLDH